MKIWAVHAPKNNRDQPIISEPICQLSIDPDVRHLPPSLDLRDRVPSCRQVELIRLVRQLGDPLNVHRVENIDLRCHLQRIEILAVVCKLLLQLCSLRILFVQSGAYQILFTERNRLEVSSGVNDRSILRNLIVPTSGTAIPGICDSTIALSAGLSSTKTKLSGPRLSSRVMDRIFSGSPGPNSP